MLTLAVATIALATVLNILLKRLHMPTIIGYIFTGVIIGMIFSIDRSAESRLALIGEFGVVFLMFTIGLEFSVETFLRMWKNIFLFGGLQFASSLILFFLLAFGVFGLSWSVSLIIAAALTLSSTAIVLRLLTDSGEMQKEYAQKSLGILLFQDLAVIPILLFISILSTRGVEISHLVLQTIGSLVALVVILGFAGRFLLEPFFRRVIHTDSDEIFIAAVLVIVLSASVLAHDLGLSYSLGALIAGIMIAETPYKHQVEADLIPFRDLLLGVFFLTVGLQIDLSIFSTHFLTIMGVFLGVSTLKVLITTISLQFFTRRRTALKTGLALFQVGEFALIIFSLAAGLGLFSTELSQILTVSVILSMIMTPLVLRYIPSVAEELSRLGLIETVPVASGVAVPLTPSIIIIGYGRLGRILSRLMSTRGESFVVIERDDRLVGFAREDGRPVIWGNALQKQVLASVDIAHAKHIIISIGKGEQVEILCDLLSRLAPEAHIIVKVNKYEQKALLDPYGVDVVVETEETARSMMKTIDGRDESLEIRFRN